jgi:hypothetical protein
MTESRSEHVVCPNCGAEVPELRMLVDDEESWWMLMPVPYDPALARAILRLVEKMKPKADELSSADTEDGADAPF